MSFVGRRWCFCQAEDGIRDLVRSRGLGDVYKRQPADVLFEAALALNAAPLKEMVTKSRLESSSAEEALSLIHI